MNMKKVLVINGSRNYVSKGYKIISKIQKGLDSNKFEMVLFDPNKLQLEFCRGCKNCFNTGKCPLDLKDSGKLLKDSMIEADFIIFLSPVYAHNVSGDIKNIIDRLSYWLHLFPLLGKPGIIVTTTDTNGHKPVEEYLEHTVCLWGIDIILKENFYNTYSQQNIESRIEKIVNVINQMNFSKMPHFTSYQEAAFQNYKFAFSLNKETEEHRYWEENGLFCADSMEELYKLRIISIIFNSIISGGSTVYPLIIALLGYNMVNLSLVSMGTVVAFLSLVQLFVQPLLNLLTTMAQFIMLKLYLKRINEILAIDDA